MIANANGIGGVVGENLRAAVDWLPQGKKLLAVKTDCELPFAPSDLVPQPADAAALRHLYARFEFKSWLKDPGGTADGAAATSTEAAAGPTPRAAVDRHYETLLDQAGFEGWLATIERAELVSFAVQTSSLDPMQSRLVGLSFAVEPGHAAYLPLAHRYAGAPAQLAEEAALARLKPWLENPRARKVGQNIKYDQHVLANHGIALRGVAHDTLLQSYVLESHRPHDLDSLAWRHLDVKPIAYAEVTGKGAGQIGFEQVAVERATEYAAEDADVTLQLHARSLSAPCRRRGAARTSTSRSSCRRGKCCSAWSATAC